MLMKLCALAGRGNSVVVGMTLYPALGVFVLAVALAGCGSPVARLEQVNEANCRRIVAERGQGIDQFTYQKCRAYLMRQNEDTPTGSGR
jgi:hypothetical protein